MNKNAYQQCLDKIYKLGRFGIKLELDTIQNILRLLNNPQKNFSIVHIAGTNGKGSTATYITSILRKAGFKTGLYTSPHLVKFNERIAVNGEPISDDQVVKAYNAVHSVDFGKRRATFFEITTAMGFYHFAKENVNWAVIETGMGGRLDSTNIIKPELSIITNISKDHTQFLGDTIEKIAFEKAGIIKKGIPVIIGESQKDSKAVFLQRANELSVPVYFADEIFQIDYALQSIDEKQNFNVYKGDNLVYPNLKIDLLGLYQKKNLITALQAMELLKEQFKIDKETVYKGLSSIQQNTGLKGRWQIIGHNPRIVCDTGHNKAGIKEVLYQIKNTPYRKLYMIIGVVNDKNIDAILSLLPKNAEYIFTKANIPRALDEKLLAEKAQNYHLKGTSVANVPEALALAKSKAESQDMIFVGGSTFVVAEVL
ncbi:MAG: bifunctional folylpolyglutamate synthase/dihydrofolate synthase [Desulfobacula sp.]|nr:bifunctional folylpolyglutamate synthase/dihydrofolate synthase [Desulfobacula sp.]